MKNEYIDETIDRVAAELTGVPADPDFSSRLRGRLQQPRRSAAIPWLVIASASVAMLIAGMVITREPVRRPDSIQGAATTIAPMPVARGEVSFAPNPAIAPRAERAETAQVTDQMVRESFTESAPEVDSPVLAALSVDELTIDDVEVKPLGITTLEISDIDTGEEPKEPF